MLRDLALGGRDLFVAMTLKDGAQFGEIARTAHAPEAALRFVQCGAYSAQQHLAVAPAFDVARVMRDRAVHVLDRVGGSIIVLPFLAVQYLKRMVSKQERFSRSTVASGRSLNPGYTHKNRNSLSLVDDPDVARISGAIESQIAARLAWILETLNEPPFRIGRTRSSCICFRNGSFFRPHIDTLKYRAGKRRLTWVYYLNSEPKRFSGGDLVLYHSDLDRRVLEPVHGRIVVFRSAISHEVTPVALSPDDFGDARFSITGFIGDQPTRAALLAYYWRSLRARLRRRRKERRARRRRPAATAPSGVT